jgi:hypothetical protein
MSLENQGVFQLLKEVTFRRIMAFFSHLNVKLFTPSKDNKIISLCFINVHFPLFYNALTDVPDRSPVTFVKIQKVT